MEETVKEKNLTIKSIQECKEEVAKKHLWKSWAQYMEHAKTIDADYMDEVLNLFENQFVDLLKRVRRMSRYKRNHDEILYSFKDIHRLSNRLLRQLRK